MSDSRLASLTAELEAGLADTPHQTGAEVAEALALIDPEEPNSLTYYGVKLEKALAEITDRVATRGLGRNVADAAQTLGEMINHLNDFKPEDVGGERSFWQRLTGSGGIKEIDARFRVVAKELDDLARTLEGRTSNLLTDALTLERLEQKGRDGIEAINAYITAGMSFVNDEKQSTDARFEIASRVRDMLTARTIAGQGIATMQMMRNNIGDLMERMRSLLNHALPLWRQQTEFAIQIAARVEKGRDLSEALASVSGETDLDASERATVANDIQKAGSATDAISKVRDRLSGALSDLTRKATEH